MVIDTNEDKILQKTNKDGTRTGYSYDAMGNLTTKVVYAAGASAGGIATNSGVPGALAPGTPLPAGVSQRADYVYNYQDQLSEVRRNGEKIASYGYDTKRQRVYRQVYQTGAAGGVAPGNNSFLLPEAALREAKNGRLYMWDSAGRSIGEAEATTGRIVVRYIYSGNEKVAMERVDAQSGARSWYYFVNNAQGTPVLILDESGGTISRVNLDEWGNVGQLVGPASEVNYTGKKMDTETGLYYFNQRYYDPSLGRFLTEDPAGQGLNPYAYAGNSPLMYVDPDGEFFWALAMVMFKAAATSAAINATAQLVTTGQVNWNSVGQSALSGALSGGLSFGVGEIGQAMGMGGDLAFKTMAHGVSGGIQSAAFGGDFGSGFAGGVAGNLGGHMMGDDLAGRIGAGALAGGVGSMVAGGDFWQGAQAGGYNQAFNWGMHEGLRSAGRFIGMLKTRDSRNYEPATEADAIKEGFQKQPFGKSVFHTFGPAGGGELDSFNGNLLNVKYTSPDGHYEAVYIPVPK
jgi:RHS repeat-associated protein